MELVANRGFGSATCSFLRHPGFVQAGEIGRFKQRANFRPRGKTGRPQVGDGQVAAMTVHPLGFNFMPVINGGGSADGGST